MSRQPLDSHDLIHRMLSRGFTRKQVAAAVGRSPDQIERAALPRDAKRYKPAANLREGLADVLRHAPRKATTGPLKPVLAPRVNRGRRPENIKTPGGTYSRQTGGQTRKDGDWLVARLVKAAAEGKKVVLKTQWELLYPYPPGTPPRHHANAVLFAPVPLDAEFVLNKLEENGYDSKPEDALARIVATYSDKIEEVAGLEDVSLYVIEEIQGWGDE